MPAVTFSSTSPLRVVIADDSAFMRQVLGDALAANGIEVVGFAQNGDEALGLCTRHRPDVLSLDLAMPGLDGIGVLRTLRDTNSPVAVVVVSGFSPAHGARAVDALAEGAVDLVAKPTGGMSPAFFEELVGKLRLAARSRRSPSRPAAPAPLRRPAPPVRRPAGSGGRRPVVIACSTGGPKALAELVPALPGRLGAGTLIVQHMPPGFTASLASRLDRSSAIAVREAAGGERLDPGVALLAPGGSHLRLAPDGSARLSGDAEIGGLRPRADLTITDAARLWGSSLLLVVLTGMGRDGLAGAKDVRAAGGRILVEAESTCTIYGMPRAIAEAGLADAVLPLPELARAIAEEAA